MFSYITIILLSHVRNLILIEKFLPNIQTIKYLILKNLSGKDSLCHLSQWLAILSLKYLIFLRHFEKPDESSGPYLQKNIH